MRQLWHHRYWDQIREQGQWQTNSVLKISFRIVAGDYRLLLQHSKQEIVSGWFEQLWAMKKQSKGICPLIKVLNLSLINCCKSTSSTSEDTRLNTSSPKTAKLETFCSSKTLTFLQKPRDSLLDQTLVSLFRFRSCRGGNQRHALWPPNVWVYVRRSLSYSLEIGHQAWLVREYSKVNINLARIVWRRLNANRD